MKSVLRAGEVYGGLETVNPALGETERHFI